LLKQIGLEFEQASMDIDESLINTESPSDYVCRMAVTKAHAAVRKFPNHCVLAADTTVVCDEQVLLKPDDISEAVRMLKLLSGRWHEVITAVAIAVNKQKTSRQVAQLDLKHVSVMTRVHFTDMSDETIEHYISTGEPFDKAGGYGIQGKAALFIDRIEGSYTNVVGLPLMETGQLLTQAGYKIW